MGCGGSSESASSPHSLKSPPNAGNKAGDVADKGKDSQPRIVTIESARSLAKKITIIDGHIDLPHRLYSSSTAKGRLTEDIAGKTIGGEFDYPRAKAGGLDAPFMSIYVPASFQETGGAKRHANALIDIVETIVKRAPERFALAYSPNQLQANAKAGLISLPLGLENGAALEGKLENVGYFARRGVRYISLTHAKDNRLADSAYDDKNTWKGLSPFGRAVIKEMNAKGVMVDVSLLSDAALLQAVAASQAPVIASHSSCRHFTPGFKRNMSDELIRTLAKGGGVMMINFGSNFLTEAANIAGTKEYQAQQNFLAEGLSNKSLPSAGSKQSAVAAFTKSYREKAPYPFASVADVADHIDRVVKIAGIDHIGLGSDFDGESGRLPTGLKDVSAYPNLIQVLLERGYSTADIEKICSKNLLRVWTKAERFAATKSK